MGLSVVIPKSQIGIWLVTASVVSQPASMPKQVAQNFTAFMFRISQETGINVLDLVAQLKGTQNKMQLNKVISYYLNSFKSKISMYGVGTIPKPNLPVARNIVI